MDNKNRRLSLAYHEMLAIPEDVIAKYGPVTEELDLTSNHVKEFRFLVDFPLLTTLIVDHNAVTSRVKFPLCDKITTLWANNNNIANLSVFISTLSASFPNLRILSMMNNEAAPSYFNGGTVHQYNDYRYYVISNFPLLEALDDAVVTKEHRAEAERIYGNHALKKKKKKQRLKSESDF